MPVRNNRSVLPSVGNGSPIVTSQIRIGHVPVSSSDIACLESGTQTLAKRSTAAQAQSEQANEFAGTRDRC
jgi:hypothetical protein